jgi:hypothetical protein
LGFLKNKICYAIGSMDRVNDGGIEWRRQLIPQLKEMGVKCIDPTNKPSCVGTPETPEERAMRRQWKLSGEYDKFVPHMKSIKRADMRFVAIADFIVGRIDVPTFAVGTYDELFGGNREKKPILLFNDMTKEDMPDWLFSTVPHEHLFGPMDDLIEHLWNVNLPFKEGERHRRWFDFGVFDLWEEYNVEFSTTH